MVNVCIIPGSIFGAEAMRFLKHFQLREVVKIAGAATSCSNRHLVQKTSVQKKPNGAVTN